jgi:hypothetical protein
MAGLDRIEAAVRAGEVATAHDWLGYYEPWAERAGAAWTRAVAFHGRALLADDDEEAERLFGAALDMHAQAARPFERARTSSPSASSSAEHDDRATHASTFGRRSTASRHSGPNCGRNGHASSCARVARRRVVASPTPGTS